jgi:hypothetical protein
MPRITLDVDPDKVVTRLPADYPHIGVYDVRARKPYAAGPEGDLPPIERQHASLFRGAQGGGSIVVKDRFICFWFYPPKTRSGLVLGYPIDWHEHNLLVRLTPQWSYVRGALLPAHQTAAIEANINHQLGVGEHLMGLYRQHGLNESLSVHLIGPRATDSLFYAHRWEPRY